MTGLDSEEQLLKQLLVACVAGCSLSTLSKSVLTINPGTEQAQALLAWWRLEGTSLHLQPVGGDSTRASG